eukprot:1107387-Alexandrium_andersonii.AAC.1
MERPAVPPSGAPRPPGSPVSLLLLLLRACAVARGGPPAPGTKAARRPARAPAALAGAGAATTG